MRLGRSWFRTAVIPFTAPCAAADGAATVPTHREAALFVTESLGRCMPSALAIVHTRSGGSMPGFLSLMCVVDRRVQALTGAVLVGLAVFGCITLI